MEEKESVAMKHRAQGKEHGAWGMGHGKSVPRPSLSSLRPTFSTGLRAQSTGKRAWSMGHGKSVPRP
jgi:hypothetical protein